MKKLLIAFLMTVFVPQVLFGAQTIKDTEIPVSNSVSNNSTTVTSIISDKTGPVPGVAIIEKGTTNGTITDANGAFSLNLNNSNAVLEISSLGYEKQTINAKSLPKNILLEEKTEEISASVATVRVGDPCEVKNDPNAIGDGEMVKTPSGGYICKPKNCLFSTYSVQKNGNNYACLPDKSKERTNTKCTETELLNTDQNAIAGTVLLWDETTGEVLQCYITKCKTGYHTNPLGDACVSDCSCGETPNTVTGVCEPQTDKSCTVSNATSAELDCKNGKSYCRVKNCADGFKKNDDETKCVSISGDECTPDDPNASGGKYETQNGKMVCVPNGCVNGFNLENGTCTPKMVLSAEQYQNQIRDLSDNAQKMRENETSWANRAIGAAGIGATGIGGAMVGAALSERAADDDAERAMRAYLETFRCDYGAGKNIKGGEVNVELPGGNDMIGLYTQYARLANDLKIRKDALGIRPGIESEVVIDKASTGLYDDVGTGITGGTYASIARALLNPDGPDAKMWADMRAASDKKLTAGAITAGVGAVGSLAANIAVNHNKGDKSKEIIARYEKLRAPLVQAVEHVNQDGPADTSLNCSNFKGTTGIGKSPNCVCADQINTRFKFDLGGCVPCESNKIYNQSNECVCPSETPRWNDAKNSCDPEPTICPLANKLKQSTKCECVENAHAPDDKNCQCKTDEGFTEKDGQCIQKETPPEHDSGREIGNFSFSADALFASSRWEIKQDKLNQLRRDLENAKQTATAEKIDLSADDYCVVIVGKTDRTQYPKTSSMNNTKLSLNRANSIKSELKSVFKESNILTYGIAAKDCPRTKYPTANAADCRRVDVTWLAGSCKDNKDNPTNWINNVAEATDAVSELQSLLKK